MALRIRIACPAARGSRQGNRITALRWARVLRSLGHRVRIATTREDAAADVLVALHARRSAASARAFAARHPTRPLIVALTGTDLYRDLARQPVVARTLALADRLVVLQPAARAALPRAQRRKARVIYQSAPRPPARPQPHPVHFDVCVLSHLRAVKDPLRAALAARRLPFDSRVRILHAGRALTAALDARARREAAANPRYRWLGERSHRAALALLARSRLLVLSSRIEGGANVIGEAAVRGVPVLATRIAGCVGLLGRRHPGLFTPGDTAALARLLVRAERDPRFYARLVRDTRRIAGRFDPARERRAWRQLLAELAV